MFSRYAIYFVPSGHWGDFGASWLGWDNRSGKACDPIHPHLTDRPRKYGFHATIKPPFRLAESADVEAVQDALETCCATLAPVPLASLQLAQIGRFFAMTAPSEREALQSLAGQVVRDLDPLRAPLNEAELARRRASRLSARQEELLAAWGYPYVMEEFKFHLTLTGPIKTKENVTGILEEALRPVITEPLSLDSLSLLGEAEDGRFHEISRVPLGG